jgi:3-phenylpropionate/trans-cinnamate dioxygenase ferredoxin reductase component
MSRTVVVVGAGQAGCQTVASLRDEGFGGRIVLVGDEPHAPYQRPPLSKGYLTGKVGLEGLWLRAPSFYQDNDVELRLGTAVTRIDRAAGAVELATGERLAYGDLVLATGARNRALPVEGADLDGVLSVRHLADADDVRRRLAHARSVVVIGGGFIGLEIAATAVQAGIPTTVLEVAGQLMGRVLSDRTASFLVEAHRRRGTRIELNVSAAAIHGSGGGVSAVATADGRSLPADLVIVGIGAVPNVELAAEAGLPVEDGIVVDEYLRTADQHIWAVGDCAAFPCAYAGGASVRLESVQNAVAQPRALAAALTGRAVGFRSVPWFWSDQADLKIQIAGLCTGHDTTVVHGDVAGERFSTYCFDGDRLLGVESVNRPADHMAARKLLASAVPPRPEDVTRPGFDPRALATGRPTAAAPTL